MAKVSGNNCPKHGEEDIQFKCRYCCSPAVWYCFGTTHFCEPCHNKWSELQEQEKAGTLPKCPVGPGSAQLPGTEHDCPLGIKHPATGTEFIIGCATCLREKKGTGVN